MKKKSEAKKVTEGTCSKCKEPAVMSYADRKFCLACCNKLMHCVDCGQLGSFAFTGGEEIKLFCLACVKKRAPQDPKFKEILDSFEAGADKNLSENIFKKRFNN